MFHRWFYNRRKKRIISVTTDRQVYILTSHFCYRCLCLFYLIVEQFLSSNMHHHSCSQQLKCLRYIEVFWFKQHQFWKLNEALSLVNIKNIMTFWWKINILYLDLFAFFVYWYIASFNWWWHILMRQKVNRTFQLQTE